MRKIDCDTFLNYCFISNPQISPDGKYTAFVLQKSDTGKNRYLGNVHVINNNSGEIYMLVADVDITVPILSV